MSGTCTFLGIYAEQIEDAGETLDALCKEHGIDADEVWQIIDQDFKEFLNIPDYTNFSDLVTSIIFGNLKDALEKRGFARERIDYYVNGTLDTNFYIDGEVI